MRRWKTVTIRTGAGAGIAKCTARRKPHSACRSLRTAMVNGASPFFAAKNQCEQTVSPKDHTETTPILLVFKTGTGFAFTKSRNDEKSKHRKKSKQTPGIADHGAPINHERPATTLEHASSRHWHQKAGTRPEDDHGTEQLQ
ncbi:hypothetical protein M2352_001300 [Azospirillum fermentarium]|nr:hypothetical protein [Azospirillum fermentarium]